MFAHFLINSLKCFRIIVVSILLLNVGITYSQEINIDTFKYEIELGTDNDFLVAHKTTDQYYTYGINATFRWKRENPYFLSKLFSKKTGFMESLGFNMGAYTPNYKDLNDGTDRPYAGWSYFDYQVTYGFEKSFLRLGADIGVMGPDSQAGALQNWFHEHVSGDRVLDGWKNQIENQLGVNLRGFYAHSLYSTNRFETYGAVDASLGNIFTYVNPTINFRIGKFNTLAKSTGFQNALMANTTSKEFFFEFGVGGKLSAFDATLQGDKINDINFINNKMINNFHFNGHVGIYYALKRWSVGTRFSYSHRQLNDNDNQQYVMVMGSYRFN